MKWVKNFILRQKGPCQKCKAVCFGMHQKVQYHLGIKIKSGQVKEQWVKRHMFGIHHVPVNSDKATCGFRPFTVWDITWMSGQVHALGQVDGSTWTSGCHAPGQVPPPTVISKMCKISDFLKWHLGKWH